LIAGIDYWQSGSTHLYNVNPPLSKLWSTLPIALNREVALPRFGSPIWDERQTRSEFVLGGRYLRQEGKNFMEQLITARRMCAVFAVAGTLGVFCLAWIFSNTHAAFIAAVVWAFHPSTLSHGAILGSDIPGAAMGCWAILASYLSLRRPTLVSLFWTGVLIGLAVLTKFTWLVAIPLWIFAVWWFETRLTEGKDAFFIKGYLSRVAVRVFGVLFVAWFVVCSGYRWHGMLEPLGEFRFVSNTLRGENENRFRIPLLSPIPALLPGDMIRGIDQQWEDFDQPRWGYLNGQWQRGGWSWYYLNALGVKLPLGSLLLFSIGAIVSRRNVPFLMVTLGPSATILLLISLKTNMNEHTRYLWLILPLLIVLGASAIQAKTFVIRLLAIILTSWSVYVGVVNFPCGLSYTNELLGGSRNAWRSLAGSNLDWDTEWIAIKKWMMITNQTQNVAFAGYTLDGMQSAGLTVSSVIPSAFHDRVDVGEEIEVLLILPVDARLKLQRDYDFPTRTQQLQSEKILCCTELYRVPLRSVRAIREIVWLDPNTPYSW